MIGQPTPVADVTAQAVTRLEDVRAKWRWLSIAGAIALLFGCVFFRFIALNADPDWRLDWSTGLFTDEAYYFTNARNQALFGVARLDEFNNMTLSPILHLAQLGVFNAFGVGYAPLRALTAVLGLAAAALLGLAVGRLMGRKAGWLAFIFLVFDHAYLLYNRVAIMETPLTFLMASSVVCFTFGASRGGWTWFLASGLLCGAAAVSKFSATILLPGLVVASLSVPIALGLRWRSITALLAGAAVAVGIWHVAWRRPNAEELTRMVNHYRYAQLQPRSSAQLERNVRVAFAGRRMGWMWFHRTHQPVLLLLCALGLLMILTDRKLRRGDAGLPWLFGIWLLCGLALMTVVNYSPTRYYVIYFPAMAGLSAWALTRLPKWALVKSVFARRSSLSNGITRFAVAAFCALNLFWLIGWHGNRTYQLAEANDWMRRNLPASSVVVGNCAPPLCAETAVRSALVIPGLANWPHPIQRLRADYVAILGDEKMVERWWSEGYPDALQPADLVRTFDFGRFSVALFRVNPRDPGADRTATVKLWY